MAHATVTPDLYEALAQVPGESAPAHAAFLAYVRMGPGRSLRQLHAAYCRQSDGRAAAEKPPTTRLRTLEGWSAKYHWQARLAAYRQEIARQDQELWEARQREVREQDWQMSSDLRELVRQAMAQMPQFLKTTRRVVKGRDGEPDREVVTIQQDLTALIRALEVTSKLQRQAAEVQPAIQEVKHSGAVVTAQVNADDDPDRVAAILSILEEIGAIPTHSPPAGNAETD